jgi:hypothetical protein
VSIASNGVKIASDGVAEGSSHCVLGVGAASSFHNAAVQRAGAHDPKRKCRPMRGRRARGPSPPMWQRTPPRRTFGVGAELGGWGRRGGVHTILRAVAVLAASLVCASAVPGELAIELPQNATIFASDERPRLLMSGRAGVEWHADFQLAYRIQGLNAGAYVFDEHSMSALFPVTQDEPADERIYTEVYFAVPAGEYEARVVLSQLPADACQDYYAHGHDGSIPCDAEAARVDLWSDIVRFSVADGKDRAAAVPPGTATGAGHEASGVPGREQRGHGGVYFDYPPTAVHDFGDEEPRVTFRVEGDFGDEHVANVYLNGRYMTQASTPKASILKRPQ